MVEIQCERELRLGVGESGDIAERGIGVSFDWFEAVRLFSDYFHFQCGLGVASYPLRWIRECMSRVENAGDPPTGDEPKQRWQCPAGHTSWERTNSHIWCHACSQDLEGASDDVDPEWYYLIDTRTDERVPFEDLKDDWPPYSEVNAY